MRTKTTGKSAPKQKRTERAVRYERTISTASMNAMQSALVGHIYLDQTLDKKVAGKVIDALHTLEVIFQNEQMKRQRKSKLSRALLTKARIIEDLLRSPWVSARFTQEKVAATVFGMANEASAARTYDRFRRELGTAYPVVQSNALAVSRYLLALKKQTPNRTRRTLRRP